MRFMLILLVLFSGVSWGAEPLRGGVQEYWSIDDARREAFREAKPWVDVSMYPPVDPHLLENRIAVQQGGGQAGNRIITVFSSGGYGVSYESSPLTSFQYEANGEINSVTFFNKNKLYKHCLYKTCQALNLRNGAVWAVGIEVSERQAFLFNPDGKLISEWRGDQCYKADGSSCGTRRSFKAGR